MSHKRKKKKRNIFLGACDEIISRASLASTSVCVHLGKEERTGFFSVGARWGKNHRIVYTRFPGKNRHERALASACGYGTSHIALTRRSPEREQGTKHDLYERDRRLFIPPPFFKGTVVASGMLHTTGWNKCTPPSSNPRKKSP